MALRVCARCGATLTTLHEAATQCPTGEPEDAWHVDHEQASRNPEEHCSRMELEGWRAWRAVTSQALASALDSRRLRWDRSLPT
jgi:hypothetical protein